VTVHSQLRAGNTDCNISRSYEGGDLLIDYIIMIKIVVVFLAAHCVTAIRMYRDNFVILRRCLKRLVLGFLSSKEGIAMQCRT
jgi:hypothetical protein